MLSRFGRVEGKVRQHARLAQASDHYNAGWRAYEAGYVHDPREQADESE
jgi:hypothetical protein